MHGQKNGIKKGDFQMDYNDQMKNRVKRIEGQLRGILKMMEEEKDCKDVITQLSAARTAIDRTIGVVVSSNLVECVRAANEEGENTEELVKEAVNLLVRSR
jgi:DNA-binding FrmR family transcriptional regulator